MSRFELGGYGEPIPLPEDGLESVDPDSPNRLPLVLNLPDGTLFLPGDYTAFGYTHYEVTVIGASGGNGGGVARGSSIATNWQAGIISYGGAGGGGGLHVVTGALADLPSEVLVQVGLQGANGDPGSDAPQYIPAQEPFLTDGNHLAVGQPAPPAPPYYDADGIPNYPYSIKGGYVVYPNLPWAEVQALGIFALEAASVNPRDPATDGGDGGASKFGDIAMASGGKGGKKSPWSRDYQWTWGPIRPGGDGGDGGSGGTDVAGGGAPGTVSNLISGSYTLEESPDGTWDGTIGKGGGGGRGGSMKPDLLAPQGILKLAYGGNGGSKGSFNYGDTSRYGPGEEGHNGFGGNYVIPGTGGGATTQRRVPGSIFGGGWTEGPYSSLYGQIPGRNPNGVVVIRLTQII